MEILSPNCPVRMSKRLFAHIPLDYREFTPADRPKIIAGGPSQRFVSRNPIAVCDPRACSFQPLHEPWNVECRGELEQHVHMVARHAKRDGASAVAVAFR